MSSSDNNNSSERSRRPFIGLQWDCCGVYSRVYRRAEANHYLGRCPRCGKSVRIEVAPGGTDARFFRVR